MINVRVPAEEAHLQPRITVIGVGGAGGNAVNNMIRADLKGVEYLVCNTDAQALQGSNAEQRLQLGLQITKGLGAGANPERGRAAAEEAIDDIIAYLEGSNMAFITAGMGGGTGTGAAPVVARAAREQDILTVGVVTKPFHFEGAHRMRLAEEGIKELQQYVDTLIIIPNQNLFRIASTKTTFAEAFKMADDVLYSGVRGVTDLMVMPGLINLDFADIRAVMSEMGKAMMGTGEGEGEQRAIVAAEAAISNPLLDEVSLKGARAMLINITAGMDISLFEVDEAVNRVRSEVDPDANVIFGSTFDETMEGRMRVSVVATGIDAAQMRETSGGGMRPQIITERRRPMVVGGNVAGEQRQPVFGPAARSVEPAPAPTRQPEPIPEPVAEEAPQYEQVAQPQPAQQQHVEMMHAMDFQEQSLEAEEQAQRPQAMRPEPIQPMAVRPIAAGPRPMPSQPTRAAEEPQADQKRPTLFERMIGPRQPERPAAAAPVARPQPVAVTTPSQANLGIDSSRQKMTKSEEELLDIPAFLRRQAN
jgi:cell division protein FtsZ